MFLISNSVQAMTQIHDLGIDLQTSGWMKLSTVTCSSFGMQEQPQKSQECQGTNHRESPCHSFELSEKAKI
jgi:hypothetical protein